MNLYDQTIGIKETIINHPIISVSVVIAALIIMMLLSHFFDVWEGNFRHKMIKAIGWITFVIIGIIVFIVLNDQGVLVI